MPTLKGVSIHQWQQSTITTIKAWVAGKIHAPMYKYNFDVEVVRWDTRVHKAVSGFTLDTIAIGVLMFYHYYSRFPFSRHSLLYEHVYLTWPLQRLPAMLYLYIGVCKC